MNLTVSIEATGEECGSCRFLDSGSRYRPSKCSLFNASPERYWRGRKGHLRLVGCHAAEMAAAAVVQPVPRECAS